MKPAAFTYHRVSSVAHALSLLEMYADEAKVIAGGQSLGPMMNMRLAQPQHLIDLNGVTELAGIRETADALVIGAMTRHHDVATSAIVRAACPLLADAVATVGHYAIRQRGTLGGSLVHADPAAQIPLAAVTLGATVEIAGARGTREAQAADFIESVMTTDLAAHEMVTAVRFPKSGVAQGHGFEIMTRRHGDFAIVACAVAIELDGDIIRALRIGLGGVSDKPVLLEQLAAQFCGEARHADLAQRIGAAAAAAIDPEDSAEISSTFRREVALVLTRRAVEQALGRAGH